MGQRAVKVGASKRWDKEIIFADKYLLMVLVQENASQACAPTGIAAANIDLDGTDVGASTIHSLFDP